MKFISFCLVLTFALTAVAQDSRFTENKAKMLANINERIQALEANKGCIEAASDKEALKKCHEQAKVERKKFRAEVMDNKMKRLEKRKERLESKE